MVEPHLKVLILIKIAYQENNDIKLIFHVYEIAKN
jgi:hypothetical protein